MKRLILGLLFIGLLMFNLPQTASAAPQACPALPIKIRTIEVEPKQAAAQHVVKIAWVAPAPECYTINRFVVKGTLTFANGQSKTFTQIVAGDQTGAQIPVPGPVVLHPLPVPAVAPRSVSVAVQAEASASFFGVASPPSSSEPPAGDIVSPSSCLPPVQVTVTEAIFTGLVFSPENPAGTHFPKVKVTWQAMNLPPCYTIEHFTVTVLLRGTGGTRTKSVTVPPTQTQAEVVFDNFPVAANFQPGVINAKIAASGTASIKGFDHREFPIQ